MIIPSVHEDCDLLPRSRSRCHRDCAQSLTGQDYSVSVLVVITDNSGLLMRRGIMVQCSAFNVVNDKVGHWPYMLKASESAEK